MLGGMMNDPVVKAIQAGIISIAFSEVAASAKLGRLPIRSNAGLDVAFRLDGTDLHFNRERVKSLTIKELKAELLSLL
ncbi:hypothetical protein [Neorhizobium galegae]|uniref:hypothetical protein n=1 Tax=Neorhizobium galegae TaxID=399 RepID=UPI002106862C|nr:hypothetical protein [Neorhizobium galegae]MCQ1839083.1 hypothetical protein [Neorhizobium galegae]